MSLNEINPGNSLNTGVDSFTGLPGSISDINRDLFRQALSKAPNSNLGGIPMNPLLESEDGFDTRANYDSISATQTKARSGASSVYGDESGTFPIDRAAVQVGKALMDDAITAPLPSGDRVDRTGRYDELLNPNPSNLATTVSWLDRAYNETYSTPNVTSSSSREASSLDSPLKYEPGVPLQYDEQVKQWQQRMQERGWNIADDGLYGSQSAQIARQFQQEKGLGIDGIVGPDTWAATFDTTKIDATNNVTNSPSSGAASLDGLLKYEPGVPLKYDEQVKQWQQRMSDRGWNIIVDGLYGPQSAQIARQFQQEKGLAVDGIVGPDTWAATFDTNNATGSIPAPPNTSTPLSDPAQKLLNVARSYIGVQEQGGNNRGRQVEEFQRAIGGAEEEPWCMSFAQYCIKAAESATQANSQVTQSEHCLTVWNGSPSELRRSRPEPGSLVIWRHGNSTSGHVGIVEAVNSDGTFTTIEGNTSDSSGINREGDGVYRKQRDMDGAGDMRVVGFLKVFPDYTPADASKPSSPPESSTTPTAPPATGKPSPIFGDIDPEPGFGELNIWRYDTMGRSNQGIIERGKETVVVIHGWDGNDAKDTNIHKLAREASESDDVQVLVLDWSSIAQAKLDRFPPPYKTAGWIAPVARWAQDELVKSGIAPNQLTLVGHSFGSYVSSEIARQFGQVKNLVALDPAFPARIYDIDRNIDGKQSPADFSKVAANSLAFVASNFSVIRNLNPISGIAGDNDKAASAHDSFVIQFPTSVGLAAHSLVVDVFTDALDKGHLQLPNLTLPNHENNWYSDGGNKLNFFTSKFPDWLKGPLDLNHHEGRISATSTGDIQGLTLVVDSSGTEQTIWT